MEIFYNLMLVLVLSFIQQLTAAKSQLLKLCSQAEVPLYLFESVLTYAAASSKIGVDFSAGCQTLEK